MMLYYLKYYTVVFLFFCLPFSVYSQSINLSGTVSDQGGSPIEGATVRLAVSGNSATTGSDGSYEIIVSTPVRTQIQSRQFVQPSMINGNIVFGVEMDGENVNVDLFDLSGRLVCSALERKLDQGNYSFNPVNRDISSGVYLVRIKIGARLAVLKISVVKRTIFRNTTLKRMDDIRDMPKTLKNLQAVDTLIASAPNYSVERQAINSYSGDYDFTLQSASFGLVSPDDGEMVTDTRQPTLSWNQLSGAVRYEVWLNITKTDYDWMVPGSLLDRYTKVGEATGTSFQAPSLPDRWTYKWYVVAVDGSGNMNQSAIGVFGLYLPDVESVDDGVSLINGCRDLNRDGSIQPFENWRLHPDDRADDLLARMSTELKAYQLFYNGKEYPLAGWQQGPCWPSEFQDWQDRNSGQTPFGIPMIACGDCVHGWQTVYPTQLGLSATRNLDMVYRCADMHRREQVAGGYRGTLSPMAEVGTCVFYNRIQEGCGEDADFAAAMMRAMICGHQGGPELNPTSMIVCTKHWPGQGASNEATCAYDEVTIKYHIKPWIGHVDAGGGQVMIGYAGCPYLENNFEAQGGNGIYNYLRDQFGYKNIICTDWLPSGAWVNATNWGADVNGGANPGNTDMNAFADAVGQQRLDEACWKVLNYKFRMGLFENPYPDPNNAQILHSQANFELAIEAASQSLTLLRNDGVLPLDLNSGDNIVVAGPRADHGESYNIWTSYFHDEYGAKTIYEAIQDRASQDGIDVTLDTGSDPEAAVVCVGEASYTHGTDWDGNKFDLPDDQLNAIMQFVNAGVPTVVVLILPRQYIITSWHDQVNAVVAAYRPGDGGGPAVAGLLFGDYEPRGKLPFQLPRSYDQIGTESYQNQVEKWDLPYDIGATEAERAEIRTLIDNNEHVPPVYGDPLYQYGSGIQGW